MHIFFSEFVRLMQDLNIALSYHKWIQWLRISITFTTTFTLIILVLGGLLNIGMLGNGPPIEGWMFLALAVFYVVAGLTRRYLERRRRKIIDDKIEAIIQDFNSRSKSIKQLVALTVIVRKGLIS